jgi:hypothetical protein
MTENILQEELDLILAVIKEAGDEGLSARGIESKINFDITRRTLQRRLARLEADELIEPRGPKSARRYSSKIEKKDDVVVTPVTADGESEIPISGEAREIRSEIRKPIHLRKPVSYRLSFFTEYQPNKSKYLSDNGTCQ